MFSIKIVQVNPVIDYSVKCLCVKPYPGHKKGCPNFNYKKGCPPGAPKYDEVYDLSQPVFAIVNKYDFGSHVASMKALHPEWSQRQAECCLYWQPAARKQLFIGIKEFLREHHGYHVETCPEAMGAEITKTLEPAGIMLEWPPITVTYQVALAGIRKEREQDE